MLRLHHSQKQRLASVASGAGCYSSIASAKPHIANLAFAEVFENAVSPVAVRIPMFKSLFACDDNYHRLDLQALHRVRERLVSQRTGIINQIRAFLV